METNKNDWLLISVFGLGVTVGLYLSSILRLNGINSNGSWNENRWPNNSRWMIKERIQQLDDEIANELDETKKAELLDLRIKLEARYERLAEDRSRFIRLNIN